MAEAGRRVVISVIVSFVLLLLVPSVDPLLRFRHLPDEKFEDFYVLDFMGLLERYGRRAEEHNATTEDGYILTLFRLIPNNRRNDSNWGPPIYLQHAFLCTADMWIAMAPKRNIALLLSDAGYDVWIGNLRGTVYSSHQTLSRDDSRFWDFSLEEYALKDLPALLDHVLNVTERPMLSYLGMSLGTTISTILLSQRTDYNHKLNVVVHFAPVHIFKSQTFYRRLSILLCDLLHPPNKAVEILPQSALTYSILKFICGIDDFMKEICRTVIDVMVGRDREQWDHSWEELLFMSRYVPAGSSLKVLFHYRQFAATGKFGYYDYQDPEVNLRHYGQSEAPDYNLTNVAAPIAMFKAPNDPYSTLDDDIALLSKIPPNTVRFYEIVKWKKFNHIDFIVAKDVVQLVYVRLFEILAKFTEL